MLYFYTDPNTRLTFAHFVLMSCSVLESDPEFGFEQAKQQLEGIQIFLFSIIFIFVVEPFDSREICGTFRMTLLHRGSSSD